MTVWSRRGLNKHSEESDTFYEIEHTQFNSVRRGEILGYRNKISM